MAQIIYEPSLNFPSWWDATGSLDGWFDEDFIADATGGSLVTDSGTPVASETPNDLSATSITINLATTVVGAVNYIWLSANTTLGGSNPTASTPTGFDLIGSGTDGTGPPVYAYLFRRVVQSGDPSSVTSNFVVGSNAVAVSWGYEGIEPTGPERAVSIGVQAASSTSKDTETITSLGGRIVSGQADRNGGGYSAFADTFVVEKNHTSSAAAWVQHSLDDVAAGSQQRTMTGPSTGAGVDFIFELVPASGLTAVGDELQTIWNLNAVVNDSLQTIWNLNAILGDTVALVWNNRINVNDSIQLVWNEYTSVNDSLQVIWNDSFALQDTLQLLWNVEIVGVTAVGKDLQLIWNISAAAGDTLQSIWNTNAPVADTLQAVWNNRAPVADTMQAIWNDRANVFDTLQIVWGDLVSVSDTLQSVWNVSLSVSDTIQLLWNDLTNVQDSLELIWNALGILSVSTDLTLVWNITVSWTEDGQTVTLWTEDGELLGTYIEDVIVPVDFTETPGTSPSAWTEDIPVDIPWTE